MRDLNELRRLAKAASYADADNDVDLAFMAAVNPVTFLAILDRLERAETDAARLLGLLIEAGKALEPFAEDELHEGLSDGPDDQRTRWPSIRLGDYRTARTVATKIEEALK